MCLENAVLECLAKFVKVWFSIVVLTTNYQKDLYTPTFIKFKFIYKIKVFHLLNLILYIKLKYSVLKKKSIPFIK